MHDTIPVEECRKCPMFISDSKDFVRCGRSENDVVLALVVPQYDFEKEKMAQMVLCNKEPRKLKVTISS